MALILCPECNNSISDKAVSCPKCGYPIAQYQNLSAKSQLYDVVCTGVFQTGLYQNGSAIKVMTNMLGFSIGKAGEVFLQGTSFPFALCNGVSRENAEFVRSQLSKYCKIEIAPSKTNKNNNGLIEKYREETETPIRCPRCGSLAVTTGERGYGFLTGFLGSNKTTNRCAKCGHSWQPK